MEQNSIETYLGSFNENSFIKFPLHLALNCLELHKDRVDDLTEVFNDKEYLDKYCNDNNITYEDAAVDLEIAILDLKETEQFLVLHSLEKMN
jgi:hypothetical protein